MSREQSRKTGSRHAQRGAAMLIFMALAILVASIAFLKMRSNTSLQLVERDRTADALRKAKEHLLAYAVNSSFNTQNKSRLPGQFPCPDSKGDGKQYVLPDGSGCESYVGRLPFGSEVLNMAREDATDGENNMLWYAVSHSYTVEPAEGTDPPSPVITVDTPATLDSTLTNKIVAAVFAPGLALTERPAEESVLSGDGSTSTGGDTLLPQRRDQLEYQLDYKNYLEQVIPNTTTQTTASALVKDIWGASPYFFPNPYAPSDANDRWLTITVEEVQDAIQKAMAREVRSCLDGYAALSGGKYPWAVPLVNSVAANADYKGVCGTYFGRFPWGGSDNYIAPNCQSGQEVVTPSSDCQSYLTASDENPNVCTVYQNALSRRGQHGWDRDDRDGDHNGRGDDRGGRGNDDDNGRGNDHDGRGDGREGRGNGHDGRGDGHDGRGNDDNGRGDGHDGRGDGNLFGHCADLNGHDCRCEMVGFAKCDYQAPTPTPNLCDTTIQTREGLMTVMQMAQYMLTQPPCSGDPDGRDRNRHGRGDHDGRDHRDGRGDHGGRDGRDGNDGRHSSVLKESLLAGLLGPSTTLVVEEKLNRVLAMADRVEGWFGSTLPVGSFAANDHNDQGNDDQHGRGNNEHDNGRGNDDHNGRGNEGHNDQGNDDQHGRGNNEHDNGRGNDDHNGREGDHDRDGRDHGDRDVRVCQDYQAVVDICTHGLTQTGGVDSALPLSLSEVPACSALLNTYPSTGKDMLFYHVAPVYTAGYTPTGDVVQDCQVAGENTSCISVAYAGSASTATGAEQCIVEGKNLCARAVVVNGGEAMTPTGMSNGVTLTGAPQLRVTEADRADLSHYLDTDLVNADRDNVKAGTTTVGSPLYHGVPPDNGSFNDTVICLDGDKYCK